MQKTETDPYSTERFDRLIKELKLEKLDEATEAELTEIFRKYQSIFHLEGETLSVNNFYKQKLNLTDNSPVYIKTIGYHKLTSMKYRNKYRE